MALFLAIIIAAGSIGIAALIAFAGGMRTTGATASDRSSAVIVLVLGLAAAGVMASSHWIGW